YEAIHTGFESHLVTLKKYNSQQTLKKASPKTFECLRLPEQPQVMVSKGQCPLAGFRAEP
ncbi:hypothetical protein, partial [Gluconacetobacter entanii]|uniref:hypothetical protein n=1 Tax=Gluconacetobacter entanii TaxID=108528 RepID=UPI0022365B32